MEIEKETILLMSKGDKKAYETMFRRLMLILYITTSVILEVLI